MPAGEEVGGEELFSTAGLQLRTYLIVLSVDADGVAGPETPTAMAVASFATADRTPPLLTVVQPEAGGLLGGDLEVLVAALDQLSSIGLVEASVDGGAWHQLHLEDASSGLYGRPWEPLAEGGHTLVARATDAWDNSTESSMVAFEVDLTPPVIAIQGVVDGGTYAGPVTPTFTVQDLHPGWSTALLDARYFVSGTSVDGLGGHLLRVVAEDAAGNRAEAAVGFAITAQTMPELQATKVATLASDVDGNGVPSPGDELAYEIQVRAAGTAPTSGIVVTDPAPVHAGIVSGSVSTSIGTVTAEDPVTVAIATLAPERSPSFASGCGSTRRCPPGWTGSRTRARWPRPSCPRYLLTIRRWAERRIRRAGNRRPQRRG